MSNSSAVYTGIKKPESFSHSGFLLKVARQLPLNTPKNPNRKTHLRSGIFWNSAGFSRVFCQCKRLLQPRRYYSGFWSRGTWPSAESPDRGPRRNAHYVRSKVERSHTYAHHLPKNQYKIRGFSRMRFSCKKTRMLWVFLGSVNGTTKNPGFWDFGLCQCKWAFWEGRWSQSYGHQTHTRFTGTAGRVHCVRIFTHFPCYEPACWSLNFMHFQTSVIRLVDRLTWFYRFGITLQINLSPKVCDLSVMFWINIYKLGLKKYPLKSRNFGNLVCLYLGYHGNYTRFICF